MKLFIKHMVSARCEMMVKSALEERGLQYSAIELGSVVIDGKISSAQRSQFAKDLKKVGLELIENRTSILVERIKNVVIHLIHYSKKRLNKKFSDYLSEKLNYSYTYLSNVFSKKESTTLERFVIKQKIERVKELLLYDELTLTEISHQLQYSSVAHLSNQFKKVTGLTPTAFKRLKHNRRIEIEKA